MGPDDCEPNRENDPDDDKLCRADEDTLGEVLKYKDCEFTALIEYIIVSVTIVVADTNDVAVSTTDDETVPESVSEAARADGDEVSEKDKSALADADGEEVSENDTSALADAILGEAEVDADGELVMVTDTTALADATLGEAELDAEGELVPRMDLLSRFVTDVEADAEVVDSVLSDANELEDAEAEGEIDPEIEVELLRDGKMIVLVALPDDVIVFVPQLVRELVELTVVDGNLDSVSVAIPEEETIGEFDMLALNVSEGEGDVDTLYELLPVIELEPVKDPNDDAELESELESLLKADELDEYVSELLPDDDI